MRRPLLLALLLPMIASTASAAGFEYTVSHAGREVGKVRVTTGAERKGLVPIRAKGRLVIPGTNLDMTLDSRSAMTTELLLGRLDWKFAIFGAPRSVDGGVTGNRFRGTARDGPSGEHEIDVKKDGGIGDLLTLGFWFGNRPADATEVRTSVFTGFFVYDVVGVAGPLETLALPSGPLEARRWEITVTRPGKTRTGTLWTDPRRQIPVKALVSLDFLGNAEVQLSRK